MFGKKRKLAELEAAARAAKGVLATDNLDEMERVASTLRDAWFDAGGDPSDAASGILFELRKRIEVLRRRPLEQALRACSQCGGRELWVSTERRVEELSYIRVVVCDGCGATTMFWVPKIREHEGFAKVTVPEDSAGPFR